MHIFHGLIQSQCNLWLVYVGVCCASVVSCEASAAKGLHVYVIQLLLCFLMLSLRTFTLPTSSWFRGEGFPFLSWSFWNKPTIPSKGINIGLDELEGMLRSSIKCDSCDLTQRLSSLSSLSVPFFFVCLFVFPHGPLLSKSCPPHCVSVLLFRFIYLSNLWLEE